MTSDYNKTLKDELRAVLNQPAAITQTTRIGISQAKDMPWRFYITGNPYVSKTT